MIKKIKHFPNFLKEVRDELKKVNWSKRQELVSAGIVVVIASVLVTLYIFFVDMGMSELIQLILK
ncbi:MAG: preprotein translocase subunit SecE [Candidatus Omnitrophica bacterium]|nr:preprotein translocase subunit SecE [Candidatus Omnitrophota bacterium]